MSRFLWFSVYIVIYAKVIIFQSGMLLVRIDSTHVQTKCFAVTTAKYNGQTTKHNHLR